jgi:hypothetical protein
MQNLMDRKEGFDMDGWRRPFFLSNGHISFFIAF